MTSLSPRALARIEQLTGSPRAKPRTELGADTRAIVALAERIRRKLVDFAATPARDPKTGAFTVGSAISANALRKAWRIPSRIAPRPQLKTALGRTPTA